MENDNSILEKKEQNKNNHSESLEFHETITLKNFSDDNLQLVIKEIIYNRFYYF